MVLENLRRGFLNYFIFMVLTSPWVAGSACETLYRSKVGAEYNLTQLCDQVLETTLSKPEGAKLSFGLVEQSVECGTEKHTAGCIAVPGLAPTSIGHQVSIKPKSQNLPGDGIIVTLSQGSPCEVMPHKNRTTSIHIQCPSHVEIRTKDSLPYEHLSAREGLSPHLCEYYVTLVSQAGCPLHHENHVMVSAVTGCKDSYPPAFTQNCSALGGSVLHLHGSGFMNIKAGVSEISIGQTASCDKIKVVNDWSIKCTILVESPLLITQASSYSVRLEAVGKEDIIITTQSHVLVSFTAVPNFAQLFHNLEKYGVGGMGRQALEIYKKVFLTRTLPSHILRDLGLSHVRGLVLHGAPGTGKSLLSRTVASIMNAGHVQLVSSPEILNKYVGESEFNLRALFARAEKDWEELGSNSPLHVIVLDELDAICKPRGRDVNNLGSLVYDSLVNQLLTKLDGLRTINNLLVIGLTNRFELLEPALLRPGRFEVVIEMALPDQTERQEIFNVHLKDAVASGRLADDVDFNRLALLTDSFTPAQIAGLVRKAQSSALWSAQVMGSVHKAMISWSDFENAFIEMDLLKPDMPTASQCKAYLGITDVTNSSLPRTALVTADRQQLLVPCLQLLLEKQGYTVKIYTPRDVLKDSAILESLHVLPSSVQNDKVALVMADLCYMINLCYGDGDNLLSDNKVHSFLLAMRAFITTKGKEPVLVAICQSHCNLRHLKVHFTYLFGMVTVDTLSTPSLMAQNKTMKAKR